MDTEGEPLTALDRLGGTVAGLAAESENGRRAASILLLSAQGAEVSEIAEHVGCSERTVRRVQRENEAPLEAVAEVFLRTASSVSLERWHEAIGAILDAVCDPGNRNQAQAFRALSEVLGLVGKAANVNVHVGDVHVKAVDARSIHVPADTDELRARLTQLEREAGLR